MRKKPLLLILLLISSVLIISCGGKSKDDLDYCEEDSDCKEMASTCQEYSCDVEINTCDIIDKPTPCCGNDDCETPDENECTCEVDCGKCEGIITFKKEVDSRRDTEAQYLSKECNEDEKCIVAVKEDYVKEEKLRNEFKSDYFTIEEIITFNNPFVLGKDSFTIKVSLKDATEDKFHYPIQFNKITFYKSQDLFGEKKIKKNLDEIGDEFSVTIPLDIDTIMLEEEIKLKYQVDYEFEIPVKTSEKDSNDNYIYTKERIRSDYTQSISEKVTIIKMPEDE